MKIVFATANRNKLEEVQKILGNKFEVLTPADCGITEDIPENKPNLEGNALEKARYIYSHCGVDCFADDTGLEVEALYGEPGVRSARYAGEAKDSNDNMDLLLKNLEDKKSRQARFRTIIALIIDGREYLFEGRVDGTIRKSRSGDHGFGYDPIFQPDGYDITFAEMDMDEKNKISHRSRAINKLVKFLETL